MRTLAKLRIFSCYCVLDLITNIEIVNFDHWHPKLDATFQKMRDFKAMSKRTNFVWGKISTELHFIHK